MTEKAFEFDLVWALPEGTDEAAILDAFSKLGAMMRPLVLARRASSDWGLRVSGRIRMGVISETVKQAMTGLPKGTKLREVKPDLISLADVAARLKVTRQALQKRKMPPPSLGGLYRASEMPPYLDAVPGS